LARVQPWTRDAKIGKTMVFCPRFANPASWRRREERRAIKYCRASNKGEQLASE
jgi:hypothetical protein